ncbi:MAG: CBS domain-containing protein [Pseudomonadota bacterium]
MKVEQILHSKGVDVFAVNESDTVRSAIDVLGEKNIGAVVVKAGNGQVAGILSERDVVRQLRQEGPALFEKPVTACMTADPFTCSRQTSVNDLMVEMTNKRVRHMPVVEDGTLVGLVSIGDVVKRKIEEAEREAAELKDYISS